MSREKHIEEMAAITAKLLDMDCEETPFFAESNGFCELFDNCGVCKGARLLLNAGYRKQEWISVEERLPKEGVRVLVWLKGDNSQYTSIDTDRLSLKKWVRWGRLVTHWMELPEPPKGE